MPQKNSNKEEYISLTEATKYCDYTQEYLSLRARQGKLKAKKFGRNWVTTKEWVEEYFAKTNSSQAREQGKKRNGAFTQLRAVIARSQQATWQSLSAVVRLPRRAAPTPSAKGVGAVALLAMTKAGLLGRAFHRPELRYAIAGVLVFVFLGAGFVWAGPTLSVAKDLFVEGLAVFSEETNKGISKFSRDAYSLSDIAREIIKVPSVPSVSIPTINIPPAPRFSIPNIPPAPRLSIPNIPPAPRLSISIPNIPPVPTINIPPAPRFSIPNIPPAPRIPSVSIMSVSDKAYDKLQTTRAKALALWQGASAQVSDAQKLFANFSLAIDKNFPSTKTGASGVVQNFRDGKNFVIDGIFAIGDEILRFARAAALAPFRMTEMVADGIFSVGDSAAYGLGYTGEMVTEYTQWLNQTFVKQPIHTANTAEKNFVEGISIAKENFVTGTSIVKQNFVAGASIAKENFVEGISIVERNAFNGVARVSNYNKSLLASVVGAGESLLASATDSGISFYSKYVSANDWVESKIQKVAKIPTKLSNIFYGVVNLAEQETQEPQEFELEPEPEPEQEIEEAAKEFAETGDMEKLQQKVKELEARGYQQKEIIKEVKRITQVQPVQKITKQTNIIDSQALITLATLEDRIDSIEKWEKDIRNLQSITKKLQANPPTTAASTAPIYIGSQGIQVGGAGIFSSLGVSGSAGVSNLSVGGSSSLGSTSNDHLTVAASSNFTGPITITNNITQTGAFTQSGGQVTLGGNVDATAGLDITGGDLTVGGTNFVVNATSGDLVMIGNLSLADITASGDVVISGGLTVGGDSGHSFTASSTSAAIGVTQTGTGPIFSATSTTAMTSNAFIVTNLGTGLSFIVEDESGDASPFAIAADGKVGIGTSTPAYALDVIGIGKFSASLGIAGTATTTGTGIEFAGAGNITTAAGSTWQTTSGSLAITSADALNITGAAASTWKTTSGALTIQSAGALTATSTGNIILAAGGLERMTILASNGYVGIATSTPSYTLDVWGDARFGTSTDGALFVDASTQRVGIGTTTPSVALEVIGSIVGSGGITVAGQAIFSKAPTLAHQFEAWDTGVAGSNVSDSTVYINSQTDVADSNILGIRVNGLVKFLVDAEGDTFVNSLTSAGSVNVGATTISTLTVENNTILGDADTDTITAIARFSSDLIPLDDNTYDLGSDSKRWDNIYSSSLTNSGAMTIDGSSDVVQLTVQGNDPQNADLAVFEQSDGTDLFVIDGAGNTTFGIADATSTITGGVNIDANTLFVDPYDDRVGIGTATPAYDLHVAGQCVTDDTEITVVSATGEQSKIQIKDIKPGMRVLSLNEKTGELAPAKVKALLDMDVKPVFELETSSGKKVRTTGNHPYLVENTETELISFLSMLDMSNVDTIGLSQGKFNPIIPVSQSEIFALASFDFFDQSVSQGMVQFSQFSDFAKNSQSYAFGDFQNFLCRFGMKGDIKHNNYFASFANLQTSSKDIQELSRSASAIRFSVSRTIFGLDNSIISTISSNNSLESVLAGANMPRRFLSSTIVNDGNDCSIYSNYSRGQGVLSSPLAGTGQARWIKVVYLQPGMKIAVADTSENKMIWDEIVSIKELLPEHVYDLSIQGTHNFVANGIIAHNTYISADLTVAGTATTTGTALTFNGVGTISSATAALNITGAAESLWQTSAGALNITAAAASTWQVTSGQLNITTAGGSGDIVLTSAGDTLFDSTATFTSTSTDVSFALGDAGGTNNFYIRDDTGAAQFTLNSNGDAIIAGNLDVAGEIDNGLVAWWPLDEGAGLTASDKSKNSNDGTITGHICPSGYALVPGNTTYGTSDFCVMKYEAKLDTGSITNDTCTTGDEDSPTTATVTSVTAGSPLAIVNLCAANKACENSGGHLITNNEWMTIARNIEQVDSNWSSGVVGAGKLKIGNNGTDESGVSYNGSNPDYGTDRNSTAKLALSNGEEIWDLSGNVWEWTNDTCSQSNYDTGGWYEWTRTSSPNLSDYEKPHAGPLGNYDADEGVGRYYGCTSNGNAFIRGGYWNNGACAGAFALHLGFAPSAADTGIGFRCVR